MQISETTYRGRFAPSPTGPLHFGSLVAAAGSYLQARSRNGEWQVRIDDLDRPRVVPGAANGILRTLETFGMEWSGPVIFQSCRSDAYRAALESLRQRGLVYPCTCSRREIVDSSTTGPGGVVYPGTCRSGAAAGRAAHALRVRVAPRRIEFVDAVQGLVCQELETECGDFVLRRADGLFAYQLAVVVDDAEQGITEIVRGADLLTSTPRQIYLQQLLGLRIPGYVHLPVVVTRCGEKLSKQTLAQPADSRQPVETLLRVLAFLGQPLPPGGGATDLASLWRWAVEHWRLDTVPPRQAIQVDGLLVA